KVDAIRPSKGKVEVAHILIADTSSVGKQKIDEVYAKLQKNNNFEQLAKEYSNDDETKFKGGSLPKFSEGRMVKPFENAAFSLHNVGDYSKPFKTRFGWHIVKLLHKYPVKSFHELKKELTNKIKRSSRMQMSETAVINKLKKKYKIVTYESAKKILNRKNIRDIPNDSLQHTILSINNNNIKQKSFVKYIKNRTNKPVFLLFDVFKNREILNYYKNNLINTAPEYAYRLKEYKDGLLLFNLMQQKIWTAAVKDTLGLQNYFYKNKAKYGVKELKNSKGKIMNDYQEYLEQQWIADLRKNNTIRVRKRQLKKLIKYYTK
ncbi:MAG: peptidylprolyl isomerase, partial [Polaribacter sp.]